jgi:galactitol-specific phosphotransferase system IIB component
MLPLLVTYIYKNAVTLCGDSVSSSHITENQLGREAKEEDQKREKEHESRRIRNEEKEGTEFTIKSG